MVDPMALTDKGNSANTKRGLGFVAKSASIGAKEQKARAEVRVANCGSRGGLPGRLWDGQALEEALQLLRE